MFFSSRKETLCDTPPKRGMENGSLVPRTMTTFKCVFDVVVDPPSPPYSQCKVHPLYPSNVHSLLLLLLSHGRHLSGVDWAMHKNFTRAFILFKAVLAIRGWPALPGLKIDLLFPRVCQPCRDRSQATWQNQPWSYGMCAEEGSVRAKPLSVKKTLSFASTPFQICRVLSPARFLAD